MAPDAPATPPSTPAAPSRPPAEPAGPTARTAELAPTSQPAPATEPVSASAPLPGPGPVSGTRRGRLVGQVMATFGMGRARLDPGANGARALGLLAAIVVVAAAGIAWWSQPRPEPVSTPRVSPPSAAASATGTGVVVAVAGKVRRPGLVTLAPGARVADAIEAAGGLLPGTDVGYLNLARKVTDGELIVVGATPPPDAAGPGAPAAGDPAGKVNLNTATLQQLDTLPGVGAVIAQRILDHRADHGGFRSVDELRQVDGIGPARYEQLKDLVTV
ncbi:MAG: helix-hairpin-helix domain-containing protein [Micromonosporaceae bacterium]